MLGDARIEGRGHHFCAPARRRENLSVSLIRWTRAVLVTMWRQRSELSQRASAQADLR